MTPPPPAPRPTSTPSPAIIPDYSRRNSPRLISGIASGRGERHPGMGTPESSTPPDTFAVARTSRWRNTAFDMDPVVVNGTCPYRRRQADWALRVRGQYREEPGDKTRPSASGSLRTAARQLARSTSRRDSNRSRGGAEGPHRPVVRAGCSRNLGTASGNLPRPGLAMPVTWPP